MLSTPVVVNLGTGPRYFFEKAEGCSAPAVETDTADPFKTDKHPTGSLASYCVLVNSATDTCAG